MNKDDFNVEMELLLNKYKDDPEVLHLKMDNLMCDLLISLGYKDGVNIFNNARKWYE